MVKIALDAGHGLNTSGKEVPSYMGVGKVKEWTLNDRICRYMEELLLEYDNVKVIRVDDRTGKKDVPRKTRCARANEWEADVFFSEHHNAGIGGKTGGGLVVFRYPNSSKFTKSMQDKLYEKLIKHTGLKGNRSTPKAEKKWDVITFTNMAATLIENGFMDSKTDLPTIMSDKFARQSAQAQVEFIAEHFGLKKKLVEFPEKEIPDELYRVRKSWKDQSSQIGAFKNLQNAINLANKEVGYRVYDAKGKVVHTSTKKKPIIQIKQLYRVRKSWKDVKSQLGAFNDLENAIALVKKNVVYNVYDKSGKLVYSYPKETTQPKTPSKPKANLVVDGKWGSKTTKALQRYFGTVVDGVISKPSLVIKELQKLIGAKVDGLLGTETITKLQKYLGTVVDGEISNPSMMVKEMQRRLNKGKL